jgi:cation transport regulator
MARTKLSSRTKKQLNNLTPHQKRTFKKAHASALKQYKNPSKRRSRSDSPEKVAHKVAWSAVRKTRKGKSRRKKAGA